MVLDYQKLIEDYETNLHYDLRGFRGGAGFLAEWVHDCDTTRSILGILEQAISSKISSLTIRIDQKTSETLNWEYLKKETQPHGVLNLDEDGECFMIRWSLGVDSTVQYYQRAISERLNALAYEGDVLQGNENEICLSSKRGKVSLSSVLDESGMVVKARHSGATQSLRAILDYLCELLEHRPIQEGADHGGIRLDGVLRDSNINTPVRGLLIPEVIEPEIGKAIELTRDIYRQFLLRSGEKPERNFWVDPLPVDWRKLSPSEQKEKVQVELLQTIKELKGLKHDIDIVEVQNGRRVVLGFPDMKEALELAPKLIWVEREVKRKLGVSIELQLESLEDKNKRVERTRGLAEEPK